MIRKDQELVTKAAKLAAAAHMEWREFIAALATHASTAAQQCVASTPDQLQRMQGRAQVCAELVSLLDSAVKSADSITHRRAAQKQFHITL